MSTPLGAGLEVSVLASDWERRRQQLLHFVCLRWIPEPVAKGRQASLTMPAFCLSLLPYASDTRVGMPADRMR